MAAATLIAAYTGTMVRMTREREFELYRRLDEGVEKFGLRFTRPAPEPPAQSPKRLPAITSAKWALLRRASGRGCEAA